MNYVTIKLHEDTRRLLRLIAAQTGEQMVQVMDRLCRDEWSKMLANVATSVADEPQQADPPHGAHGRALHQPRGDRGC
jgi:hypothetical protein